MNGESLAVVIPAYNEERRIGSTIECIHRFLSNNFKKFEIIIVDDGSRDRTADIVLGLSKAKSFIRIFRNSENRGKGYSVKKGALLADSGYVAFTDADLSTPIEELSKLLRALAEGAEVAIGSRALGSSNVLKRQSLLREKMGKTFNFFVRTFLFKGIKDTQCGFKCFRKYAAEKIFTLQRLEGFAFDAEILFIAKKLGLKIKEVPVSWSNRDNSRVGIFTSPPRMFLDIFRIKGNHKKRYYENK